MLWGLKKVRKARHLINLLTTSSYNTFSFLTLFFIVIKITPPFSYIHYSFDFLLFFFYLKEKKRRKKKYIKRKFFKSCVCVWSDVRAEWIYPSALNVCSAAFRLQQYVWMYIYILVEAIAAAAVAAATSSSSYVKYMYIVFCNFSILWLRLKILLQTFDSSSDN